MKRARLSVALLAVVTSIVGYVVYRNQRPSPVRAAQEGEVCGAQTPEKPMPHEIDFPYYSLRDGFNSTLVLADVSPDSVRFRLAIRDLAGQTVRETPMVIQSGQKLAPDLRAILGARSADIPSEFEEGSAAIYFESAIEMPLVGQLTVTNPEERTSFESEMVDNSPGMIVRPMVLNGIWWGLGQGRQAWFVVSNTSAEAATGDLSLDFNGKRHRAGSLSFLPHETKVLSVAQLLGDLNVSPSQAPQGGITIIPGDAESVLVAEGHITDADTGFSTTLHFLKPQVQNASALHASGVPIGTPAAGSAYAGAGTFIPHVIVRNLVGFPQIVTITVEYPGKEGKPTQTMLAPLQIRPYATEDISLESVMGELPLPLPYCSIRIQYNGVPGSVVGEVSSVEEREDLVVDSRLANEGDGWAGSGANPWHLDDQTDSFFFVTNVGDNKARVAVDLTTQGAHYYLTNLRLDPHETRGFNLRKLREAQRPDFLGNRIPAHATDGFVQWIRVDNVPMTGRLVVLRRQEGLASNYDCCICACPDNYTSLTVQLSPAYTVLTSIAQVGATGKFQIQCTTHYNYYDETGAATWDSLDPGIALVVGPGQFQGQAGGSATVSASYSDYTYTWSNYTHSCVSHSKTLVADGTVTVQVPASLSVLSVNVLPTGTTGDYGCLPGFNYGIMIDIKYQVLDQNIQPIKSASMVPHENGTFSDGTPYNNNIGPTRISTTSKYTAADGTFHDAPLGRCYIGPFSGAKPTQNITIILPNGTSSPSVRSQTFTIGSSGAGHGTITNGSDISASR